MNTKDFKKYKPFSDKLSGFFCEYTFELISLLIKFTKVDLTEILRNLLNRIFFYISYLAEKQPLRIVTKKIFTFFKQNENVCCYYINIYLKN